LNWQGDWIKYGPHLAEPRTINLFTGNRLLIQRIVSTNLLDVTFTSECFICNTDVITLKPKNEQDRDSVTLFLGILGSKLIGYYIRSANVNLDRETFPKINTMTLSSLPVPDLNNLSKIGVKIQNQMVALVTRMLELNKRTPATPQEQLELQRNIAATDRQIDTLVYQLYDLTPEEIAIVETENK
jgi:hypothetical protein